MMYINALSLCLLAAFVKPGLVHGYRVGEAIDTDLRLDLRVSDALRSQMPVFGIDGSAQFTFSSILEEAQTFGMTFEDGLWTIPAVPLMNKNREYLESLQVDLLYTKAGELESVSYQTPVYVKDQPTYFRVDYKWTVEHAPHVTAAMNFMVFVVFAVCIYFLLDACGITADSSSAGRNGGSSGWDVAKEHSR